MLITSMLKASNSQVDIFCIDWIEEREDSIATDNLATEIVRFECLELCVAVLRIYSQFLFLYEVLELLRVVIERRRIDLFIFTDDFIAEEISINVGLDHLCSVTSDLLFKSKRRQERFKLFSLDT